MDFVYGIVGRPLKDPPVSALHRAAFEHFKPTSEFKHFDLDPNDPESLANFCYETDLNQIRGFAVASPLERRVMDYLDFYDPIAKSIGSVNTVVNEDSSLIGYNTDAIGALQALQEKTIVPGKRALVLGTGSAGRAIAYSLKEFGAHVTVFDQDPEAAQELAKEFNLESIDHQKIADGQFDLIVNATPVGDRSDPTDTLLTADQIPAHAVVMDIVLDPLDTQLLKEAKKAGALTIRGDRMLLFSALRQFELWFGSEPPVEAMEKALAEAINK